MAIDNSVASFWYNPYQGVIRARVPIVISDRKALYNSVNRTRLDSIYSKDLPIEEPPAAALIDPATLFGPPAPTDMVATVEPDEDGTDAPTPDSPTSSPPTAPKE
jgi:hypothetical protein